MNSKVSKYLIRIVLILLGLSVIGVTLFLFLYVFWKGKTVMSLSFILDKPSGKHFCRIVQIPPICSSLLEHFYSLLLKN